MIATLTDSFHLVLAPEAEDSTPLPVGQEYRVNISTAGVIMLRPKRKHKRTLLEHLEAMRGLEFEHRRDPIPDRVQL